MKSEIEQEFWNRIGTPPTNVPTPRSVIGMLLSEGKIQNEKQAYATLEKWMKQGRYEFGVTADLGWKTAKSLTEARG